MKIKYVIFGLVIASFGVGGVEVRAEVPDKAVPVMGVYSVDTQSANLTPTPAKPHVKKKKTVKKKTPAKAAKKSTKKKVAKKPKADKAADISTTATDVSSADLGDSTADGAVEEKPSPPSGSDADLPPATENPAKGGAPVSKGLAIAGAAATSGLGLMFLLKKIFFH